MNVTLFKVEVFSYVFVLDFQFFVCFSISPQCSSVLSEKQSEGFLTKFSVLCLQFFLQLSIEVLCLSYQMALT